MIYAKIRNHNDESVISAHVTVRCSKNVSKLQWRRRRSKRSFFFPFLLQFMMEICFFHWQKNQFCCLKWGWESEISFRRSEECLQKWNDDVCVRPGWSCGPCPASPVNPGKSPELMGAAGALGTRGDSLGNEATLAVSLLGCCVVSTRHLNIIIYQNFTTQQRHHRRTHSHHRRARACMCVSW